MFEWLFHTVTDLVASMGYLGVFIFMTLESMIFPIPSEAVMPFAGFLIYKGSMTWPLVLLSSTLGSLAGSLLSYAMGDYGGRPLLLKIGRYYRINAHHLALTERFFERYGARAVFISRFIPIVRHFISIPAGMGKMNILLFSVFTAVGATLWNGFLTYLGMVMGERWEIIHRYTHYLDIVIGVIILAYIVHIIIGIGRRMRTKRSRS